jgi:hypothetical protein
MTPDTFASFDWAKIGLGISGILGGIGAYFAGRKKRTAMDGADIAQANASASISDAEGTLYHRLREEIDALRNDVSRLRSDLDTERRHSRQLELYVWQLQRLMAEKGIEVPPFLGDAGSLPGGPTIEPTK